jgi:hypothetical protein
MDKIITEEYLIENPNHIFVFGDNEKRYGTGGAAKLRHLPNTYGFITKKAPTYNKKDFYIPSEYLLVYFNEMALLRQEIRKNPDKKYLISKIGGGIANKNKIFEIVILPRIRQDLQEFENVEFLFSEVD